MHCMKVTQKAVLYIMISVRIRFFYEVYRGLNIYHLTDYSGIAVINKANLRTYSRTM